MTEPIMQPSSCSAVNRLRRFGFRFTALYVLLFTFQSRPALAFCTDWPWNRLWQEFRMNPRSLLLR